MEQTYYLNHLRSVENIAKEWKRQGYSVKANLNGWSRPNKIDGLAGPEG